MGAGLFQGTAQADGKVLNHDIQGGSPPFGSRWFRGYRREQLGGVLFTPDTGQERVFKGGLAFSLEGELLYDDGPGPFPHNVGGLAVNAQGGVAVSTLNPETFLAAIGLLNLGAMTEEPQPAGLFNESLFQGIGYPFQNFKRATEGLEYDKGVWRALPPNTPRFEDGMLLMEPSSLNKVECNNYNPDENLTNIISGVPIRRIYNPGALAEAGLTRVCPSGYIIEAFNEGTSDTILISGSITNVVPHVASVFLKTFQNPVKFGIGSDWGDFVSIKGLTRVEHKVSTPAFLSTLSFLVTTGTRLWFILPQLEEGALMTSPIRTEIGSGVIRDRDSCRWNDPGAQ